MKVPFAWLRELVNLNITNEELVNLLPLRTIGTKEVTKDFVELDMKGYNRADLLSMRGVAQEAAAITGSKLNFKDDNLYKNLLSQEFVSSRVTIENQNLCPLYAVAVITGLKVGKPDLEWVTKLEDSGMRSVNNLADVTNLVMLEYGQPLHAFDAQAVKDESVTVRTAKKGEKITTLDGQARALETTDLLITDSKNVLGIAGVMGGKESEVSDSTISILLEAAIFDPINIRRTAQRLGLHSEASKRFQHGLTKTRLLQALAAAIKMYEDLGGRLTALTIVGETKDPVKTVSLSLEKTNRLIGVELSVEQIEAYLTKLGFVSHLSHLGGGIWEVTIPYWRLDIEIEEDLIEEVARLYGYEKIPPQELRGELPEPVDQSLFHFISDLKQKLVNLGLTEIQTYSFHSTKVLESTGKGNYSDYYLKVTNPISKETEYLRPDLWPNLVEVVDKNIRQGFDDIAVFEIGKVYSPVNGNIPKEEYRLSIALMNGSDNPLVELTSILDRLELSQVRASTSKVAAQNPLFHPTRQVSVYTSDVQSGTVAEVHPRILDKFGINKQSLRPDGLNRVAVLELSLKKLAL